MNIAFLEDNLAFAQDIIAALTHAGQAWSIRYSFLISLSKLQYPVTCCVYRNMSVVGQRLIWERPSRPQPIPRMPLLPLLL